MNCQKCSKEISDDSRFCPECGAKQEIGPVRMIPSSESRKQRGPSVKTCQKCGKEIPADSRYCPECRATQEPSCLSQKPAQPVKPKEPPSPEAVKRNKIIFGAVAAAAALFFVIGILSSFIKPSINLNNYLAVEFEGYDTAGTAVVTFDTKKFQSDYGKKLGTATKKKSNNRKLFGKRSSYDYYNSDNTDSGAKIFLSNCVSWSLDEKSGLSNGDTVTLTWDCDDDYALERFGYKLKYSDTDYTVKGLAEAEVFDPFEGIQVRFKGISPDGTARIEGEPARKEAENFRYSLDHQEGLKNGDQVTAAISAYGDDPVTYCISNYGKIPSPVEKTYTVEGLSSYVTELEQISTDCLDEMKSQAEDVYQSYVAKNWGEGESLEGFHYLGSYLLTLKGNTNSWGTKNNEVYLVYKADVRDQYTSSAGDSYNSVNSVYWYITYYDVLVDPDGMNTADITSYRTPNDRFTIDSGISSGWWSNKQWYYYGYETLDSLFKAVVTANAEYYNYEDNIEDAIAPEEAGNSEETGIQGESGIPEEAGIQEETKISEEAKEPEGNQATREPGLILPNSSQELLTEEYVQSLSKEDIRLAINELYAKHGYIFSDKAIREYFKQFDWYKETVRPEDFSTDLFNDIEKSNVELLYKVRDN